MIGFYSLLGSRTMQQSIKPLFIIMDGQSNNGGKGETSELPGYLTGQISGDVEIYYNNQSQILETGVNHQGEFIISDGSPSPLNIHGSELELAYRLSVNYPGRKIYICKTGQGGKPLAETTGNDFNVNSVGELHQMMLDDVSDYLTILGKTVNDFNLWYLWMQGESDCVTGADAFANAYQTNLTAKFSDIKTNISGSIKFIISVIRDGIAGRDQELIDVVQSAMRTITANDNTVFSQESDSWGMNTDNLHFSSNGQISKGLGESQIIINY